MAKSGKKSSPGSIAQNRRARHDYFIEDKFEAGLMLMGWEVKSIRDGKVQLAEAFVQIHQGEAYLAGCNITPLLSASTHVIAEPQRMRKLLLHAKELSRLFIASQQKGYTIVPLALYWKGNKVKCEIALGKGKKQRLVLHLRTLSTLTACWRALTCSTRAVCPRPVLGSNLCQFQLLLFPSLLAGSRPDKNTHGFKFANASTDQPSNGRCLDVDGVRTRHDGAADCL